MKKARLAYAEISAENSDANNGWMLTFSYADGSKDQKQIDCQASKNQAKIDFMDSALIEALGDMDLTAEAEQIQSEEWKNGGRAVWTHIEETFSDYDYRCAILAGIEAHDAAATRWHDLSPDEVKLIIEDARIYGVDHVVREFIEGKSR